MAVQHLGEVVARDPRGVEAQALVAQEIVVGRVGLDDQECLPVEVEMPLDQGQVPLPIEPKPIMTMGPSMRP